ncbi:MAG TPA: SGNH/GDSL hydrolase family protein [Polyangia bacterium]|nr:SGNH/GDSL hydrolase family protein [Polyangia bacterium]
MTRFKISVLSLFCAAALASACSSSTGGGDTGTGGTPATGGASASGGSPATGGSGTGGQIATGGTPGTGGVTATGGVSGSGGIVGSGGRVGTGGAAGGRPASGGEGGRGPGGAGGTAGAHATGGSAGHGATGGSGGSASAYNPCPTNGDPCKVLPLGDSITFGINYEGSYRVELFKKAVTASQNITFVGTQTNGPTMAPGTTVPFPRNHEGWSGYTIAMILAKAANDVQFSPHIILLHAGTNDTYMSDPSGAPMRLSSAVDSLTTMFPNALIVVAKIIPYPSQMTNVNLINNSIPSMVAMKQSAGKHVISVDLNTGFDTKTMLSSDSIHPNQTGYDWMGDTWYGVVGPLFPAK